MPVCREFKTHIGQRWLITGMNSSEKFRFSWFNVLSSNFQGFGLVLSSDLSSARFHIIHVYILGVDILCRYV